jgi:hypothetical protein
MKPPGSNEAKKKLPQLVVMLRRRGVVLVAEAVGREVPRPQRQRPP